MAGCIPRWFACPKTVIHCRTDRAQLRVTSLIETNTLPLSQATTGREPLGLMAQVVYYLDALPVAQPTATKHCRHKSAHRLRQRKLTYWPHSFLIPQMTPEQPVLCTHRCVIGWGHLCCAHLYCVHTCVSLSENICDVRTCIVYIEMCHLSGDVCTVHACIVYTEVCQSVTTLRT